MFDDLTLAELTVLRAQVRMALQNIAMGEAVAEVRYGEQGHKFHPTTYNDCATFLARVQAAIDALNGCGGGAILPAGV